MAALLGDLRALAPAVVGVRVAVAVAWLAAGVWRGGTEPTDRLRNEGLLAWDGTWYRDIATFGYDGIATEGLRFFPAFPLAAQALAWPFGGSVTWPLIIVANVAAVAAAVMVRRLVMAERSDAALANRAAVALTLFPSAFVLVWAYSEALFLVGAIGVFWAIRTHRWGWAVVFGLLSGVTRPLGVLLMPAVAIEVVRNWRRSTTRQRVAGVGAVAAPGVSTGLWLWWAQPLTGDLLYPFTGQTAFRGDAVDPFTRIIGGFGDLFGDEMFGDGLHIPFAVALVVLTVVVFRTLPVSYGVFTAAVAVTALGADNLNSLERYMLNAFPVVIAIAVLCSTPRRSVVAAGVGIAGMVSMATLAWAGMYVP